MPFVVMSVSKVNTRTLQILGDVHQWKRSVFISCIFFHDELLLSWDALQLFFVQVLCKLATHYINVHSRQCIDEAEVVEHLVGLTSSLGKCKFRQATFTQTSSASESRNMLKCYVWSLFRAINESIMPSCWNLHHSKKDKS